MIAFIFLIAIVLIAVVLARVFTPERSSIARQSIYTKYQYRKRLFLLSPVEHRLYDVLIAAVGHSHYVFAQVHLPTIVDSKVTGQNWRGAFRHIDEKSVDFVLCDKEYISPKLAIELDDSSHLRPDRQERDREVERILSSAKLPLLRLKVQSQFIPMEIERKINEALSPQRK